MRRGPQFSRTDMSRGGIGPVSGAVMVVRQAAAFGLLAVVVAGSGRGGDGAQRAVLTGVVT